MGNERLPLLIAIEQVNIDYFLAKAQQTIVRVQWYFKISFKNLEVLHDNVR